MSVGSFDRLERERNIHLCHRREFLFFLLNTNLIYPRSFPLRPQINQKHIKLN
jgi:hypothetical protein